MKECKHCKEVKPLTSFYKTKISKDGYAPKCKACRKVDYQANKEELINKSLEYYYKNKDARREYRRGYRKRKIKTDPIYKLKRTLRSRIYHYLRVKKYSKCKVTEDIVGATYEYVKEHLQKQFQEGMTWDNHGAWHIDHIIPLASANTEEELIKLCHYSNLQPLWAKDNMTKANKI